MGTLRTIFAIAVVFAHTWPTGIVFVGGRNAVQLFYIISGFLISYVLVESKSYKKLSAFYINRYLRLYPIYFAVATLTLITILITNQSSFLNVYQAAPVDALFLLVVANTFLLGQDWALFSGIENQKLIFASNFLDSEIVLYKGLIVPQAWTLGLELSFYLIAPFVLPKRKLIYILLFLSLTLRLYLVNLGLGTKDPWTYRFFPTELAFFLLGALAHQVLLPLYGKILSGNQVTVSIFATFFLITFSLIYFLIPIKEIYRATFLFAVFIFLIPLTFIFQNRYVWDNWIGNLSYPIYIGHMFVILTSSYYFKEIGLQDQRVTSIVFVILSLVFAIFLNYSIGIPFEKIRSRIKLGHKTTQS